MIPVPTMLRNTSQRTTFLSEGIKLCGFILAICAAPLFYVQDWVAAWLLAIMTIVGLGTFGIWAYNAIKNKNLHPSEEHTEQMAAISLLGQNRTGKAPVLTPLDQKILTQNPVAANAGEVGSDGQV